jgi:hypothetical protein
MIPIEDVVYSICRTRGSHAMISVAATGSHISTSTGRRFLPSSIPYQECSDCRLRIYSSVGFTEMFDILPCSTQIPLQH